MRSNFDNNWVVAKETVFKESSEGSKKEYFLISKIVPKNQISRNRVKYNWDSVIETMNQIPGLTLNHNHKYQEGKDIPRGEWIKAYIEGDWLCGVAKVFNTDYNKDYIEWLKSAKNITVSLNVHGDSEIIRNDLGTYQEAIIKSWKEISTVNAPGFLNASSSLETILSESLKEYLVGSFRVEADLTGLAIKNKITKEDVNDKEYEKGLQVEMEHTDDVEIASRIVLDHLTEINDYYTRLDKLEESAKQAGTFNDNIIKPKIIGQDVPMSEALEDAMETKNGEIPEVEINPAKEDEDESLDENYDFEQLKNGIIRELGITNDPYEAKKVAKKNLDDDKDYYKNLLLEEEQKRKESVYVSKDKLDAIAQRRYGRTYDSLLDREKGKVLFSTDIEKDVSDLISKELKGYYIKKAVEENIDKIINVKINAKEFDSEDGFFEKLGDVKFFNKLNEVRRI